MGIYLYRLKHVLHVLHFLRFFWVSQVAVGTRLRRARFAAVALLLGGAALAGVFFPLVTQPQRSVVLACGIGNVPTMYAGSGPALLFPVTKNVPANQPIGVFLLDYTVGQPITFNEDLSNMVSPPAKSSLKWLWTFGDGTQSNDISPTHTYTKPGTYNVHAQIFSDGQWQDFDSAAIHVLAQPFTNLPVAIATANTDYVVDGGSISFDATGSHSQDGSQLTYLWNFNDGTTATGPHVTHAFAGYQDNSTGIIGLVVTDGRGARGFASVTIHIVSQLPTAAVSASLTTIGTGGAITFDASQSSAPSNLPNDQIVKYIWNFGDGTPQVTTQAPTITHTFQHAGRFTVTVQAVDQRGAPGIQTIVITVIAVTNDSGGPSPMLFLGLIALLAILGGGAYFYFARQRQLRRSLAYRRATAKPSARSYNTATRPPQRGSGYGQPSQHSQPGQYNNSGRYGGNRQQRPPQGSRPIRPNSGYPAQHAQHSGGNYGNQSHYGGYGNERGSQPSRPQGPPRGSSGSSQASGHAPTRPRQPHDPYGSQSHERE